MKILLVEDDLSYATLVQEYLAPVSGLTVVRVEDLKGATELLERDSYDAVLLDLHLPDSDGMHTLRRLRALYPAMVIVVMTSHVDESQEVQLLEIGAQELLLKAADDVATLPRLLRRAVARMEMLASIEQEVSDERRRRRRAEADLSWFDDLRSVTQNASEQAMGVDSVLQALPEVAVELTDIYETLVDAAVRRVMYSDEPHPGPKVRAYANQLAALRAGPREVTEIHTAVLRRKLERDAGVTNELFRSEGRLLLVEVMGYVLSEYRTQYVASRTPVGVRPAGPDQTAPS